MQRKLDTNENENNHPKPRRHSKAILRKRFIAWQVYLEKQKNLK